MIDDGVKAHGVEEDQVKVADVSIHLLDALEEADRTAQNAINDRMGVTGKD
jgi:hypothetical protein